MRFSKVFGIGLPRTGTTSLNIALNTVGVSSIHFPFSLYESLDSKIISQYTGFVDSPLSYLYQKLDIKYPGSGFILTTRPIEAWLKSMNWLLNEGRCIWEWQSSYDSYHEEFFGSANFETSLYRNKYYQFHSEVSNYFQGRNDLLILDLSAGYGYEELCNFLELPVCNKKYPRGNETRKPRQLQRIAKQVGEYNKSYEQFIRRLDYYIVKFRKLM